MKSQPLTHHQRKRIKNKVIKSLLIIIAIIISFCWGYRKGTVNAETINKEMTLEDYDRHINLDYIRDMRTREIKKEQTSKTDKNNMKYLGKFQATSYDLSVQSCGKPIGHPQYGITATGLDISGKTWNEARVIAVDPKVIPLHSKVYVEFSDWRSKYNGYFVAKDTGSAIKGKIVDFYMGDFQQEKPAKSTLKFGRDKNVKVWLVE